VAGTPRLLSQHVGFVFQDPEAQFVTDQVEDEIAFALENPAGDAPPAPCGRVEETLDLSGSPLCVTVRFSSSLGERQRVAIAAAWPSAKLLVLGRADLTALPKSAEDVLDVLGENSTTTWGLPSFWLNTAKRVLPFVDSGAISCLEQTMERYFVADLRDAAVAAAAACSVGGMPIDDQKSCASAARGLAQRQAGKVLPLQPERASAPVSCTCRHAGRAGPLPPTSNT
jgi:hypothetical protein